MIEGDEKLMKYIIAFYKSLFGKSDSFMCNIEMEGIPQLDEQDRELLIQDFTLVDLQSAVFFQWN